MIEAEHRHHDGHGIWMEISASLVRDPDGNPTGFAGVTRDISDRKRAEAERAALEAQNRQLRKAESLGRMAGAIAHHFNNDLQAVIGNLELAVDQVPKSMASIQSIKDALTAAQKAAGVSRQMLTYLGQTPGKREALDLCEVCRQALPMLQADIPRNVAIETDLPSEGPAVHANQNQMEQVLTHLMANAWEAMTERGGTIGFAVKTVSGKDIPAARRYPVDWHPEPGVVYACIEVRDEGPGISEKDMEKLFDPFFSTKFTGRGLGLAVVLGIVRAHGGCITVEGPVGTRKREDGGRRSEDGGQRSEDGRRKGEDSVERRVNAEPLVRCLINFVLNSGNLTAPQMVGSMKSQYSNPKSQIPLKSGSSTISKFQSRAIAGSKFETTRAKDWRHTLDMDPGKIN
ncbi:MAG: ATP-binding protein [Deltaproteobacteria bacterium]|nr:ATP-binding protein [Deltaproteobacteria bacterium]